MDTPEGCAAIQGDLDRLERWTQVFVGIYKVPSQPSLLQAKQAQLPQPLLTGEMLQFPHHPRSPPLDSLQ